MQRQPKTISLEIIDTHTHVYAKEFALDIENVIQSAKGQGVVKMLLPNIDISSINAMNDVADHWPGYCLPMMGLHPCSVEANVSDQIKKIEAELNKGRQYCGVGEIGLDFYWDTTFTKEQIEAFEIQLGWARELNLPAVIHTRNSFEQAVKTVSKMQDGRLKGVFHCFGGTVDEANRCIDLNFMLGIGGVVTFKNAVLNETLPKVNLEHLLTETDAPYLSPVPHRGKRNESAYLPFIVNTIASIYEVSPVLIANRTSENARLLFNL